MKVEATFTYPAGLPAPVGAQELAWSYLLDAVIADAYTRKLSILHVALPQTLVPALELRASLSQTPGDTASTEKAPIGIAHFGPGPISSLPEDATRLYLLTFSGLFPFLSRRLGTTPSDSTPKGWHLEQQYSVYCLGALFWGGLIRLANLFSKRDLSDRAMVRMRRSFTRSRRCPAFYKLTVWVRP